MVVVGNFVSKYLIIHKYYFSYYITFTKIFLLNIVFPGDAITHKMACLYPF